MCGPIVCFALRIMIGVTVSNRCRKTREEITKKKNQKKQQKATVNACCYLYNDALDKFSYLRSKDPTCHAKIPLTNVVDPFHSQQMIELVIC